MPRRIDVKKAYCTTREAAELLGVSLRTAQLWAESGILKAWKTEGGHRRIDRQSVARLLATPVNRDRQQVADTPPVASPQAPGPFSILVVEDDASLLTLYEATLGRWPMNPRVSTACDGYEALIRISHSRPDLIIADLHLPGMDGFRMIRTIRSVPELAELSMVVVTGLKSEEVAGRGLPGDIEILPKPVPFARLRAHAEALAGRRSRSWPSRLP